MRHWFLTAIFLISQSPSPNCAEFSSPPEINFKPATFSKNLTQQTITQTFQDSTGALWFLTQEGLNKYNGFTLENYRYSLTNPMSISTNSVTSITEDLNGSIWVGTRGGGLNKYDSINNGFTSLRVSSDLGKSPLSNNIYSLFTDANGMVWLGYESGFSVFDPSSGDFKHMAWNSSNQSENGIVNDLTQSPNGRIWAGTLGGGLIEIDPMTLQTTAHELSRESLGKYIADVLVIDDNNIWCSSKEEGVAVYNPETHESYNLKNIPGDIDSLSSNQVYTLYQDRAENIWVTTYEGLNLFNRDRSTFTRYTGQNTSLPSDRVSSIFQSKEGKYWVGTEYGLNRYYPTSNTFEAFYTDSENTDSISSNIVWAFYEDGESNLWLGTHGGSLNKWPAAERKISAIKFLHYSENIALPSSNIYGIESDDNGYLWLSHNRGVTKFNPKTLNTRQYGTRDGLQDTEFNMGAALKTKSGQILFGGNRGYNIIGGQGIEEKVTPPQVSISNIKVMNERRVFDVPYQQLKELELSYEDRMLSIEFFAADYSSPDLVQYAYKPEGINPDWVISKDAHSASFTTLPPGKYSLKLAAANPDGVWNWDGFTLPITVTPPPWLSTPAYLSYAFLVLLMAALLYIRQKKQAQLALDRQHELENKVRERTVDLHEARLAAENANKAKSQFLATMSHEIRTPMHGMIGMTELLMHTKPDEQQHKFARAAHRSGESLLELINTVLDFSKIEAQKIEIERTTFNLPKLINEICYLQAEPADKKGLCVNSIFEESTPEVVSGDSTKIRQILMNLVGNSIKFTESGHINVRVFSTPLPDRQNQSIVNFTVEDTGIGMDELTQKKVFEPFTQADASTTRKYGGTGLGLAISHQYVELLGGKVEIKSAPNVGTTIKIGMPMRVSSARPTIDSRLEKIDIKLICSDANSLEVLRSKFKRIGIRRVREVELITPKAPLAQDELYVVDCATPLDLQNFYDSSMNEVGILLTSLSGYGSVKTKEAWVNLPKPVTANDLAKAVCQLTGLSVEKTETGNIEKLTPANSSAKILVAEDVETNQKIVKEMLQLLGCEVDIAANGKEAVELYAQNNYELVFMDCQMPVMDGYVATTTIREIEKKNQFQPTPIVALTAGFDKSDEVKCRKSGMDHYITKPFSIPDLEEVLSSFIGLNKDIISSTQLDHSGPIDAAPTQIEEGTDQVINFEEVIDAAALENILEVERQTEKPILKTVFDGFTSQMQEKLIELRGHITNKDSEELYKTAHAIKSMSANMGAKEVRRVSSEMESTARNGSIEGVDDYFVKLTEAYAVFLEVFETKFRDRV